MRMLAVQNCSPRPLGSNPPQQNGPLTDSKRATRPQTRPAPAPCCSTERCVFLRLSRLLQATSAIPRRRSCRRASSVRVHARGDLSLFRTPIASQWGIHQKIIPSGMIIRTISAIIHSIFVFLCDVNGRALRKPSCAGRLRAHDTAFARVG